MVWNLAKPSDPKTDPRGPKSPFDGKVAAVTGAARGIGRAVSEALGRRGAQVLLGDVNSELGSVAARTLGAQGITARFASVDVRHEYDVERFLMSCMQIFGRLDIVVTAAGVIRVAPIEKATPDHFHAIFDANVLGTALMIKHATPLLEKAGGGTIVTVSSVSGMLGFRDLGFYCASKAAVLGLTRSMAVELAPKQIRINAVAPSLVETDMVEEELAAREALGQGAGDQLLEKFLSAQPISRMATPEEVAEAVCFLASPVNALLTGAVLTLDGGLTCL